MSDTICHCEGADRIAPIVVGDNTAAGVRVYLDIPQPELDTGNLHNPREKQSFSQQWPDLLFVVLCDCVLCLTTKD